MVNGAIIRKRREWLDLSTAQLAEGVGLSEGGMRNIEGEQTPASHRVIGRIARMLRVPEARLLEPTVERKPAYTKCRKGAA